MTNPQSRAFLALWNSISSPQLQPEYECWHSIEHVPERVGLPGFIEARRYRSHDGPPAQPPRYFTCYWLASLDALATVAYREVFTHPTTWSARMRSELREFQRLPCTLSGAFGQSTAAQLATLHLSGDAARFGAVVTAQLEQLAHQARIVCAHWGTAVASEDFPIANRSGTVRSADTGTDFVVMLQGTNRTTLGEITQQLLKNLEPVATTVSDPSFFELQSQVRQDELASPLSARQPALVDLFKTFQNGDTP